MRILSMTNDSDLANLLRALLATQGFHVEAGSAADVSRETSLVLLDERLSPDSGFEVLRRIRSNSTVPVVMLIHEQTVEARCACLEAGADDCLSLPFANRELVARVRTVLRRTTMSKARMLHANGVQMDTASREVFCDGMRVEMTTFEFEVLEVLLRSAGRVVSRDQLTGALYNRKASSFDRSIDMHVSHLRRKLSPTRTLIKTVRGAGYQFCLSGRN